FQCIRHRIQFFAIDLGTQCFVTLGIFSHDQPSTTSTPMLRALPAIVRTAASRSAAVRSGIFVLAISSACLRVILPTLSVCGVLLPDSIFAAFLMRIDAGGVFITKVKLLS